MMDWIGLDGLDGWTGLDGLDACLLRARSYMLGDVCMNY